MVNAESHPELPPDNSERAQVARRVNHELDLLNTRIVTGELHYPRAIADAERTLQEIEELLNANGGVFQSQEEFTLTMQRLSSVIAVTNDVHARDLRRLLLERDASS